LGADCFASRADRLSLLVLNQSVWIECADPEVRQVLGANFGGMSAPVLTPPPDLHYVVARREARSGFSLDRDGQRTLYASDPGDLLFLLEKDLTVELQKRRADLFFLHAAAIEWQGKVCLLVAESGAGKSTTAWALLHHGFGYLSDELSPIDLGSMQVDPYPHAVCLKRPPPSPYPLPDSAMRLGRTTHVPLRDLPCTIPSGPRPLGAVFLIQYRSELDAPRLHSISPSEASARLYTSVLNALAHPNHGLDAVVRIARHVPCYYVSTAGLAATCALIRSTAEEAIVGRSEAGREPLVSPGKPVIEDG
jgi:hypothetical protein